MHIRNNFKKEKDFDLMKFTPKSIVINFKVIQ